MINRLMRYPGGKYKMKEFVSNYIYKTSEKTYVECYLGGGAMFLKMANEHKFDTYWINDKDFSVVCLWNAIKDYPRELMDAISLYQPTVENWKSLKDYFTNAQNVVPLDRDSIVDIACKKFAIHQTSFSGLGTMTTSAYGGNAQRKQYKVDDMWNVCNIHKKIYKLNRLFKTIKLHEDKCTHMDCIDILKQYQNKFIYLDPPYYTQSLYQISYTHKDHVDLSNALKEVKTDWLLSYDDCPEIRELYNWANIDTVVVRYDCAARKSKNNPRKNELLIYPKHQKIQTPFIEQFIS